MLEITIDDSAFLADIQSLSALETAIYNDARSSPNPVSGRGGGFPYFYPVDLGRGPVFPRQAKALAIPTAQGVIFRKSAGPAPAQNIRQNAINEELYGTCIEATFVAGGESIRRWFATFLNACARLFAQSLERKTPKGRTGTLRSGYRATTTS